MIHQSSRTQISRLPQSETRSRRSRILDITSLAMKIHHGILRHRKQFGPHLIRVMEVLKHILLQPKQTQRGWFIPATAATVLIYPEQSMPKSLRSIRWSQIMKQRMSHRTLSSRMKMVCRREHLANQLLLIKHWLARPILSQIHLVGFRSNMRMSMILEIMQLLMEIQ